MKSVIRSNRDGDLNNLPCLLTKKQSNDVKEVIQRIEFPTGFASNINSNLTKKDEFGGVKTHDWHTFIKVIILVYIYRYIYCLLICAGPVGYVINLWLEKPRLRGI